MVANGGYIHIAKGNYMAGSKEKFVYTDDQNFSKVVLLDESNTRELGFTPATVSTGGSLPFGKLSGSERYINCQGITAGGRPVSRKIVVPTKDNTFFTGGGTLALPVLVDGTNGTVELVEFAVTQAVGEVRKFPSFNADTGLDDGTQPT